MSMHRRARPFRFAVLLFFLLHGGVRAQTGDTGDELDSLNQRVVALEADGKLDEALGVAEEALKLARRTVGKSHQGYAWSLNNLASIYFRQDRLKDAEAAWLEALPIMERTLGKESSDTAVVMSNLGQLQTALMRYAEAEKLLKRALAVHETTLPPGDFSIAASLNALGRLYREIARYEEAEPLLKRALAIVEEGQGTESRYARGALDTLAHLYQLMGRYDEAKSLWLRALKITEALEDSNSPELSARLNAIGQLYVVTGQFEAAEINLRRALSISPDDAATLNNLAEAYRLQHRYWEAEPLYKQALGIRAKDNVKASIDTAIQNNFASLLQALGRGGEAIPLREQVLATDENNLGPSHPSVLIDLNNLAELYEQQDRRDAAEPLYKRAIAAAEKVLGPNHPALAAYLGNLGKLYLDSSRFKEAKPLLERALAIDEATFGRDDIRLILPLNNLAAVHYENRDAPSALALYRRSTDLITKSVTMEGRSSSAGAEERGRRMIDRRKEALYRHVILTTVLASDRPRERSALDEESFRVAQMVITSQADMALVQMAARLGSGKSENAAILRERQDLVSMWDALDQSLTEALSQPAAQQDARKIKELRTRLAGLDRRLKTIDQKLGADPRLGGLTSRQPLSIKDTQSLLRPDEAVIQFLVAKGDTFIWAVTRDRSIAVSSARGGYELTDDVERLRCGLDYGTWLKKDSRCKELTGVTYTHADYNNDVPLPFDTGKAHELYEVLFGQVKDLIKGKHLLVVLTAPLTSLPLQVLVTEKSAAQPASERKGQPAGVWAAAPRPCPSPGGTDTTDFTPWLVCQHALTVLPSLSSLAALRRNAKNSTAPEPFIGWGNPVLTRKCRPTTVPTKCPDEDSKVAEAGSSSRRASDPTNMIGELFRGGLADVAAIKSGLCPLPDTAYELKCVARSLGAPSSSVVLGKDMTEAALKKAPLERYRVIHFATHGLLASDTARLARDNAEPALVMSPPLRATEEDDGLLTASEVAGLKLNADWVVMSACNTAAGGSSSGEALSGLARAFFYAGARALLVSHWPVNSYAATVLTSRTFAELRDNRRIGRAEAFRRAMMGLMEDGDRRWAAHPSIWAPFVIVGEGSVSH